MIFNIISYRNLARVFQKIYTFDSYTGTASCPVPKDSVLYENLFVCFTGGNVQEQTASTKHDLQIQTATITDSKLTISVYYPTNSAATVHWYAEVYYADF